MCRCPVHPRGVDLHCTLCIATKHCIVLQPVTRPVLVYRRRALIRLRYRRHQCILHLDARREAPPRVVRLCSPALGLKRYLCAVTDVFEVVVHELHAFVEAGLVEPVQVGQVNLQPPQGAFAEKLCFVEDKQATTEIITEVRRCRVCTDAEV